MSYFKYKVINNEKKIVFGFIQSESIDSAKEQLHSAGFSILKLDTWSSDNNNTKKDNNSKLPSFEFSAKDKLGKILKGKITAIDIYSAYEKLVNQHGMFIEWIYTENAPKNQQEQEKKNAANILKQKLEKEKNILRDIAKTDSAEFLQYIMSNMDKIDKLDKNKLNKKQLNILKNAKMIQNAGKKIDTAYQKLLNYFDNFIAKYYFFFLFSALFFTGLYYISMFLLSENYLFLNKILYSSLFRFFTTLSITAVLFFSIKIFLLKKIKSVILNFIFIFIWFILSLVIYYNV